MERRDGAARAVRLAVLAGEDQRWTMVALDHPRGADADYAAVPAFAVDHLAVGVAQLGCFCDLLVDLLDDALLFAAAGRR